MLSPLYQVHARVCYSFNFRDWHFGNPGFIFLLTMMAIAFPIAVLGNIKDYKGLTWAEFFAALHRTKWGKLFFSSLLGASSLKKVYFKPKKDVDPKDYK